MSDAEIAALIQHQTLCRIAFKGGAYPYMAPFQYVRMHGALYFHFTDYGMKMRLLERDARVCVEIEAYEPDLREYRFVVQRGTLRVVTDPEERAAVIRRMADEGRRNLSRNFLAAHGFSPEDGWSALSADRPLVIVKLDPAGQVIGLKSP